jgi:hypothetical protein
MVIVMVITMVISNRADRESAAVSRGKKKGIVRLLVQGTVMHRREKQDSFRNLDAQDMWIVTPS